MTKSLQLWKKALVMSLSILITVVHTMTWSESWGSSRVGVGRNLLVWSDQSHCIITNMIQMPSLHGPERTKPRHAQIPTCPLATSMLPQSSSTTSAQFSSTYHFQTFKLQSARKARLAQHEPFQSWLNGLARLLNLQSKSCLTRSERSSY